MALTASQSVQREVIKHNADGTQTIILEKADMVTPGDKVVYSLNYHNAEAKPAEHVILVMPVPTQVKYLEGTAENENVRTDYSVDGGQSYSRRANLTVHREDGTSRAAIAEDITHIRWNMEQAIAPGASGRLAFTARLK